MRGRRFVQLASIAGLSAILTSCGSNEAQLQNYAKAKKFSEQEKAAFMACANEHRRNKPVFASKDGNMVMKNTPMDVCACQTRTIVSVFIEEDFASYVRFAEYMAKDVKKKTPYFSRKVLKSDIKAPEAGNRLEKSLNACVSTYLAAHKDLEEPLLELLPVKETGKKDEKPKKAS
jgi:hypothetical protein